MMAFLYESDYVGNNILSKILELHVYDSLYNFLTTYKLPLDKQSGFHNNYLYQTVLIKITDYFLEKY